MSAIFISFISTAFSLSCLDTSANTQDYWIMLKAPAISNVPPVPGKSYAYISPSHTTPTFQPYPLNYSSPMTFTLHQLNQDNTISYVMYNDCIPPNCSANYSDYVGHTKGILAYTSTQAIYILHSLDQFPTVLKSGFVVLDIEDSETVYGQDLMCVTLTPQSLFSLAGAMSINRPQVYQSHITIPNANITLLIQNRTISSAKSLIYQFSTTAGLSFTYFAKSPAANTDLYESIISPYYKDGMQIQTWGRPYEPSFCPPGYPYTNLNIDEISISGYWWYCVNDHSKWGIGLTTNLVCYSDINRMTSQWYRGGGAMCVVNSQLWRIHRNIIEKSDTC